MQVSSFTEWLNKRKLREDFDGLGEPVDKFKFNQDDAVGGDHEKVQQELFKTVMNKYPEEAMQFLDGIARRGDKEIQELVSQLRSEKRPSEFKEPSHPTEGDEVVPSGADKPHSDGF